MVALFFVCSAHYNVMAKKSVTELSTELSRYLEHILENIENLLPHYLKKIIQFYFAMA